MGASLEFKWVILKRRMEVEAGAGTKGGGLGQ